MPYRQKVTRHVLGAKDKVDAPACPLSKNSNNKELVQPSI